MSLKKKSCTPCKGGESPLTGSALQPLYEELNKGWNIVDEHHLFREYHFSNFKEALEFVHRVGDVAETEGHHPDIELGYGYVRISIWTHKINGLSENDFILASKIDKLNGFQG